MWKSGFFLRAATLFCPQPYCGKEELFNRWSVHIFFTEVIHRKVFHIPQPLWNYYKQELMFAVMSRIAFCMVVLPFFSSASTLLMECSTVV